MLLLPGVSREAVINFVVFSMAVYKLYHKFMDINIHKVDLP
jgi:hypothetical protein